VTKQFHGITSLGLVAVATVVAAVVAFRTSWMLGVVYAVICIAAPLVVLYAYCARCPCKAHCGHVFPGKAAQVFDREPGPYTPAELAAMVLALSLLIGLPQFWLWRYTGLFIAYWVLNSIALVQIRLVVCRTCENVYCPMKPAS